MQENQDLPLGTKVLGIDFRPTRFYRVFLLQNLYGGLNQGHRKFYLHRFAYYLAEDNQLSHVELFLEYHIKCSSFPTNHDTYIIISNIKSMLYKNFQQSICYMNENT